MRAKALDNPVGEEWCLALHLSERDMRLVAAGVMPPWLPGAARTALVWFDEGPAAGIQQMRSRKVPHADEENCGEAGTGECAANGGRGAEVDR